jgi:DNA (cytosine-5)-methyltransferase 1
MKQNYKVSFACQTAEGFVALRHVFVSGIDEQDALNEATKLFDGVKIVATSITKAPLRVLSLFSGVGGFDMGLAAAGMVTAFQCEIDKHARSVLDRHWPTVPKWDDVSTLTGAHILEQTGGVDVVAWGSPCQDLSLAGKRAGLSGARSGLFYEGIRIIKELKELSNGQYPTFSIWENVKGALSSNRGADFGQVISEMVEAGAHFCEWAVLDAQFFNVPQRRTRLFVVACFSSSVAAKCPDPLLPVANGGDGDTSTGGKKKQSVTPGLDGSIDNNFTNTDGELVSSDVYLFEDNRRDGIRLYKDIAPTLQSFMGTGGGNVPLLPTPIQGTIIGRSDTAGPQGSGIGEPDGPMYTLDTISRHAVAQGLAIRKLLPVECERLMGWPDDHTRYNADGREQADSSRYKQCGNGVASPVAKWIGEQIVAVMNSSPGDTDSVTISHP